VPPSQPTPLRLGKYEVKRRLGGGGMAEVFVAQVIGAEGFTRDVAIKRVLPGHSQNPELARMFVTEARLLATLHHPNIVSVLDFDHDPQAGLFLVMELVEGQDLSHLLATGLLPIPLVIHIAVEILRGLGHAHNVAVDGGRGIVHRDLSPHNVLLSWEGMVKVSDFGLAKARAAASASIGGIKGKPAYMSPEQANGQALDARSDLFSVGVMVWEMLVGQPLFGSASAQETLAMVMVSQIPSPATLRPQLPADVARATMHLLQRELTQRCASAAHAMAELMACRDAPRDGRAELIKAMSDRFSNAAPTLLAAATDSEAAATITAPPRAELLPKLRRQMRQQQARAMRAGSPGNHRKLWIAIAAALIGALLIAFITLATSKPAAPLPPAQPVRTEPVLQVAPEAMTGPQAPQVDAGALGHAGAVKDTPPDASTQDGAGPGTRRQRASRDRRSATAPVDAAPADATEQPAPVPEAPQLDRDGDGIPDVR
jgi:hypothetical protein